VTPVRGNTLLIPFNDIPHLFTIMNNPCKDALCLLVMMTSIKPGRAYDPACILQVGDHPFVTHSSYILYRTASQVRAAHISNMVEKGYYGVKDDMPEPTFARLAAGLHASENISGTMLRYARSIGI
jgi:hypothetical protein